MPRNRNRKKGKNKTPKTGKLLKSKALKSKTSRGRATRFSCLYSSLYSTVSDKRLTPPRV